MESILTEARETDEGETIWVFSATSKRIRLLAFFFPSFFRFVSPLPLLLPLTPALPLGSDTVTIE